VSQRAGGRGIGSADDTALLSVEASRCYNHGGGQFARLFFAPLLVRLMREVRVSTQRCLGTATLD
jgi:hypothetical protein